MAEMSTSRRWLTIGVLVLVSIVGLTGLTTMLVGTRIFPCGSCHAMDSFVEDAETTVHGSIACTACHVGDSVADSLDLRTRVLAQMIPATLTGVREPRGASGLLPREGCLECHTQIMDSETGETGVSIDHAACAATGSCVQCHGGVAHPNAVRWVRMYTMEDCVACHQGEGTADSCDTCHTGRVERDRLAVGPWQVTHGANWRDTHGMGSVQYCATCHPNNYCVDCHGTPLPHSATWGSQHGKAAVADRDSCVTCHPDESLCDLCHGMEMPHAEGFLQDHSSKASSVEDARCAPCHIVDDCVECHENHIHPGGPNMPEALVPTAGGED